MTKQNFDFTIVKGFDEEKFKTDVQQLLNEGWQLHGEMKVLQFESGRQLYQYFQALTITRETIDKRYTVSNSSDEESD